MKDSLQLRLVALHTRSAEVNTALEQPDVTDDLNRYRELSKEAAELAPIVAAFVAWQAAQADFDTAAELLGDASMRDFALIEQQDAGAKMQQLETELQKLLLPKDDNDSKNVYLEIRAGTGGDESALFAGDLLRMYSRYCERKRWQTELVSVSESELGGYKEVILRIVGANAYSILKFESGGHRVQRVPATESQGRIHTSACTVAVLPEADEIGEVQISPDDIRIDVYRASGAGGQHVNKTESAVRITHLPTGIVAECQDDRSQHRNKDKAMKVLVARILDKQRREQSDKEAAQRKGMIGSGDRSDRIRTYNFPQGRMTDHRINLTLYKLDYIMDGDIQEMLDALVAEHQAELLAGLTE